MQTYALKKPITDTSCRMYIPRQKRVREAKWMSALVHNAKHAFYTHQFLSECEGASSRRVGEREKITPVLAVRRVSNSLENVLYPSGIEVPEQIS